MKKITLILTALLSAVSFSALATPQTKDTLPDECAKLFKETESLIAQAEKQPGTHPQVSKIKSKLNQSKKQILEMEVATQLKSCNVGLARLNSMRNYSDESN